MANLQFEDFCQKVCQMLRWKAARGPVSAELTAHLAVSYTHLTLPTIWRITLLLWRRGACLPRRLPPRP